MSEIKGKGPSWLGRERTTAIPFHDVTGAGKRGERIYLVGKRGKKGQKATDYLFYAIVLEGEKKKKGRTARRVQEGREREWATQGKRENGVWLPPFRGKKG